MSPIRSTLCKRQQDIKVTISLIDDNNNDCLINRCSSLHKLKSLTAWLLRFIFCLQHFVKASGVPSVYTAPLTVKKLRNAETAWREYAQQKHFLRSFCKTSWQT